MNIKLKFRLTFYSIVAALIIAALGALTSFASSPPLPPPRAPLAPQADNPAPPTSPVKLIFIHHSCGGNWLADIGQHDQAGGLGQALMSANYYVSATNYGWGSDNIGDNTDIGHWWDWFRGSNSATIMAAVYAETGQNFGDFGSWSRMASDPGGENKIVMFKSCYPNSGLAGNPTDPPTSGSNPLRGEDYSSEYMTVANAKGIYNDLLVYFAAHQDKLFVVAAAPAMIESDTDAAQAANARAFNDWLVNDWLDGYAYNNVAVFDFYNTLTSNGGDVDTNDLGSASGNHHRWRNNAVQHIHTVANNFSAYASGGDSHPHGAGNTKATAEFVPLLNVYYNRWQGGSTPSAPTLNLTAPDGGERWQVSSQRQIKWTTTGVVTQVNLAYSTDNFSSQTAIASDLANSDIYTWTTPAFTSTTMRARVESVLSPTAVYDVSQADFTLCAAGDCGYFIYLPLILKNYTPQPTPQPTPSLSKAILPDDFTYLGAFRLPGGDEAPQTFAYGGQAMTFNPNGNGGNGSLFITGHDTVNYVAEISIPAPVSSTNVSALNTATMLQDQNFHDVRGGLFDAMVEMPRVAMEYLPAQTGQTSAKLHLAWGAHHQDEGSSTQAPSHAWSDLALSTPNTQGAWWIGETSVERLYSVNDYIFEIPSDWANAHLGGAKLATGRYRDGGWSGMGPNIFAYGPWLDGSPPVSGTVLTTHKLLAYSYAGGDHTLNNYHDSDDWPGGAWLTVGSKSAVIFAGVKGGGDYWWYGYSSPAGDGVPCVHFPPPAEDVPRCYRSSDGSSCVDDFPTCTGYAVDSKGWWSSRFDAQILLYNPADLAAVKNGTMESYEPQPYAALDIDERLFLSWPGDTDIDCGTGDQRKCRLGAVAYDRANGLLYVLERFADEAKPVVHVWRVAE